MATLDGKKTGGRKKGSLNLHTKFGPKAMDTAERLGVDPFEILLRFSANDWEGLGYVSSTRHVLSQSGKPIEVDTIQPFERIAAAKAACEYLFPKRKSLEFEGEAADSLTALFKLISE